MEQLLTEQTVTGRRALATPEAHESTNVPDNTKRYELFMQAFTNAMQYIAEPGSFLERIWPEMSQTQDGKINYASIGDDEHARLEAQYLDRMTIELNLVEMRRKNIGFVNFSPTVQKVYKSLQLSQAALEQRINAPTIEFSSQTIADLKRALAPRDLYHAKGNEDVPTSQKQYDGSLEYNLNEN